MRNEKEIKTAEKEHFDKVWYSRHCALLIAGELETAPESIRNRAMQAAKEIEDYYGVENLGSLDDFEWGVLCGKLSTLRWVLGDEWDNLDS